MVRSRPKIILSAAMTIDGKIASKSGDSKLSSKKDKIRLHKLRSKTDAILIGKNTLLRDDPLLTVRYHKGKNPIRIILDSKGEIPPNSKIIKTCNKIPTIIVASQNISKKNLNRLKKLPLQIIFAGTKRINIQKLLKILFKQKIQTILLEGGSKTNWEFISKGFVDEIVITIAPIVVGGQTSTSLVGGEGFLNMQKSKKFKLKNISKFKNEFVVHYSKL
ncbi:2,5-diamino-6-(ribosylamino)-4(3H)-pyrimidinone 5'-phosphate reductase [Nitrosopumilus sp. b1]|uniref:dihydrofolate reductase family protein n=1 Tax=Nitrosopumilus sp. b1 TaxID=2109907 RepID=UPI0015F51E51|nr:dihydrofolate reductase family protein [Nitrosopumilus sp. b1]KAF6242118.1 2,5-diamino-6-(ribosylamino)-4(3H)-pyrimidinone 5'-phosphate reductase [Nitrosopumilus sp. b1]